MKQWPYRVTDNHIDATQTLDGLFDETLAVRYYAPVLSARLAQDDLDDRQQCLTPCSTMALTPWSLCTLSARA